MLKVNVYRGLRPKVVYYLKQCIYKCVHVWHYFAIKF